MVDQEKARQQRLPQTRRRRRWIIFIILTLLVISLFMISTYTSPEEILEKIGTRNGYIVAFFASFFAGFSAFTAVSFYSILIAGLAAGLNPVLLAIITGISLAAGDIFLYYFGRRGRDLLYGRLDRCFNKITTYFENERRGKFIPLIAYTYISLIPLPNDWLLLFLASIKYPQVRLNFIILAGDLTHVSILVLLASKGIMFFS